MSFNLNPPLSIVRNVNGMTGAQGKDQIRRLNNRRHTTNDPNRDMGLPRDPADGKDKLPDRPGKHAGPETSWPVNFHPEEVRN